MLTDEYEKKYNLNKNLEKTILDHIRQHKQFLQITNNNLVEEK